MTTRVFVSPSSRAFLSSGCSNRSTGQLRNPATSSYFTTVELRTPTASNFRLPRHTPPLSNFIPHRHTCVPHGRLEISFLFKRPALKTCVIPKSADKSIPCTILTNFDNFTQRENSSKSLLVNRLTLICTKPSLHPLLHSCPVLGNLPRCSSSIEASRLFLIQRPQQTRDFLRDFGFFYFHFNPKNPLLITAGSNVRIKNNSGRLPGLINHKCSWSAHQTLDYRRLLEIIGFEFLSFSALNSLRGSRDFRNMTECARQLALATPQFATRKTRAGHLIGGGLGKSTRSPLATNHAILRRRKKVMNNNSKASNPVARLASSVRNARERHLARHTASGFGFVFADSVHYLDSARWDALAANGSVFMQREILQVIEDHGPENICPRYIMIFRDQKPVAALVAQLVDISADKLGRHQKTSKKSPAQILKQIVSPAARLASSQLQDRMVVAGNLLSWGFHGIAFAPDENPEELWPAIAEALYRIRRSEKLTGQADFVMIKDVCPNHHGVDTLRRYSYRPLETEPNMVLELKPEWRSYEDYLAALDAKYRRNARDIAKKLTNAGCIVEEVSNLDLHSRRLHELYLAVHGNASIRLVTLSENYLPALARAAGENLRCVIIRKEETILGFVTTLRDHHTAIGYYIGFDRQAAAEGLPIYLRLLHATVDHAISWQCQRLSLGRTALEPKAALGATPQPMTVWLRHRVPAFNWVLRSLFGTVTHDEPPTRNPFKSRNTAPADPESRKVDK
jgi:hypothetical protein